jgi:hypothetical protein
MKKMFISICLSLLLTEGTFAQNSTTFPVVVSFKSMCCGVPSNEPVMKFVQRFKKTI